MNKASQYLMFNIKEIYEAMEQVERSQKHLSGIVRPMEGGEPIELINLPHTVDQVYSFEEIYMISKVIVLTAYFNLDYSICDIKHPRILGLMGDLKGIHSQRVTEEEAQACWLETKKQRHNGECGGCKEPIQCTFCEECFVKGMLNTNPC